MFLTTGYLKEFLHLSGFFFLSCMALNNLMFERGILFPNLTMSTLARRSKIEGSSVDGPFHTYGSMI
jgi:hypothetical protein